MLIAGDSGSGKTGGLVSLILAGYKLRIIDVDNKIDIILHCLHSPKSPYYAAAQKLNLADAFRYETVNHRMIAMDKGGERVRIQPQSAIVWPRIQKLAHEWRETEDKVFLGPITSWGPDTILVIDSFTFAGFAALFYSQELNGNLGNEQGGNAWRRDIGQAQDHLDTLLKLVCSDSVKCHVIIITHINYLSESWQKDSKEPNAQTQKMISGSASDVFGVVRAAYPNAVGRALGPRIGAYFNNVLEMKITGNGANQIRRYNTTPSGAIAVKTSAPFGLAESYPISTGLADIFAAIRGTTPTKQAKQATQLAKPTEPTQPTTP